MPQYKLLICRFPGNAQEHPRSAGYVIRLMGEIAAGMWTPQLQWADPYTVIDTPITMCRNRAVKYALDQGYDYILMIDSDMEPDLYADQGGDRFFDVAWKFMMERRTQEEAYRETEGDSLRAKYENWEELLDESLFSVFPPATIAAPYCGPPPSELCYVFQWANKAEEMPPFKLSMIPRDSAAVRAGIQEVAALPTGLILYDARTFRKLPLPWYDYEWVDDEQTLKDTTEDVFQTRNASVLGMPQFCAWDCWAGHNKLKTVGKPVLLPPEIVSGKLAEAMKNLPAGAKVQFMREKIMAPLPAGVEDTPEVRRRLEEVTRATTGGTMS
jgi:hypothetical protein